jgi:hypothetical protein
LMRTDTQSDTPLDARADTTSDTPSTRRTSIISQVREAVRSNRRGHSPLFLWMRTHHDDLAAEFAANTPNWQQLAQIFRDEGLTDQTGKAPSPAIARLTWYRVRQAVAQTKAEAKRKPLVSVALAAATPLPSPMPREPRPPADRPPAPSPPVQPATGADDDPIARLRRTLNERSGRY